MDADRPVWKIFIMDQSSQRIVSPLLKVNDLRENGITLFLQINSDREAINNVPAIYFVEATKENIFRIGQV